ncbi:Acyl-CoA dehydrogenase, short-chain specific [Pseudomonas fluorescens]|uniref:acyl-CoA dehydrogenase family protein n=1 Tax=Pseudomonas fluorescens TaxID=294 RepID=UPI00123F83A4|nr:acyl-CoA dehydrogenase family protein [Pseudomonas fluorescens]VVN70448.1 Acyl-CoA dehydrogenase, short-chain specific [Pseudomonas fluorescens]
MNFDLSPEQREMVATVRAVAQERIKPRAMQYLDGTFPWENLKDLAEIGVTGMAVPEEYGGMDLPVLDTVLVVEEVAKVCYTTAMSLMPQLGVQTRILSQYAPEHIKRRIFEGVVEGKFVLSVCMTEPHAGTDLANIRTNAEIKGDRVILKGTKTLISKVDEAELFVVFTRVNKIPGREGIGCVLLERGTPGIVRTGRYHTMGGEYLYEVTFEDVEVPLENLVIKENGLKKLMSAFNTQRCLNPSISLGLAEGAFEEAVKYARDRTAFGRPIGEFQGMRWKLAEMYRDIEVGRSMLYRAAASANPYPNPQLAAVAKMYCNEMALRVTSEAIQVHGGYGFTDEFPVSRFYRGARYGTLGGGTTETLKELVGKKIMSDFPHDGFLGMGLF